MNIVEIERQNELPWGLHDACLERLDVDWMRRRLVLDARVKIDERQTTERRLRVTVSGLVYCAVEAPEIDPTRGYEPMPVAGLWIDSCEATKPPASLPPTPSGAFLHQFFVHDWNRSIYICGHDSAWEWIGEPQATLQSTGFHLPGENVEDG